MVIVILTPRNGKIMKPLCSFAFLPMAALAVTVEPLPQGEYADTEASTNIAFVVERPEMTRIEFTVALEATPTNNVEVAIGADGNGDGNLSVEEAAYVFGYDCGSWFCRERDTKVKVEGEGEQWNGASCSRVERTFALKRRQLDTAWNLVKVTRRGCGATCELVQAEGCRQGFTLEIW